MYENIKKSKTEIQIRDMNAQESLYDCSLK
jgi:hypothetical protein